MTKVTQIRSLLHICCCFVTHVNLFFRPVIPSHKTNSERLARLAQTLNLQIALKLIEVQKSLLKLSKFHVFVIALNVLSQTQITNWQLLRQ